MSKMPKVPKMSKPKMRRMGTTLKTRAETTRMEMSLETTAAQELQSSLRGRRSPSSTKYVRQFSRASPVGRCLEASPAITPNTRETAEGEGIG
jgi:hypothetical protein